MYDIFEKLLYENHKKVADVAKGTGISPSSFCDWKMGRSVPKADKLQKIADYFGVSVDFLVTGAETTPAPSIELSEDELEMITLYRKASRLAQMQAFNILSNSVEEKRENAINA